MSHSINIMGLLLKKYNGKIHIIPVCVSKDVLERVRTEFVAFSVVAMEEDGTALKHPPGNGALTHVYNEEKQIT